MIEIKMALLELMREVSFVRCSDTEVSLFYIYAVVVHSLDIPNSLHTHHIHIHILTMLIV